MVVIVFVYALYLTSCPLGTRCPGDVYADEHVNGLIMPNNNNIYYKTRIIDSFWIFTLWAPSASPIAIFTTLT